MDILIKNMNMPKDDEMLCVSIYPDGKVCFSLDLDCKKIADAVSIPQHGRLIDADVLRAMCDAPFWCVWLSDIDDSPTIIPSNMTDYAPVSHGRWLIKTVRGDKRTVCSECLTETGTCYEYNYCPNCGAIMDKEGE